MTSNSIQSGNPPPGIRLTAPTSSRHLSNESAKIRDGSHHREPHHGSGAKSGHNKHVRVEEPEDNRPWNSGANVYIGSYRRSPHRPRTSLEGSPSTRTPNTSATPSPRASVGQIQLEHLLQSVDIDQETYGVEELRDGFFDASFFRPRIVDPIELMRNAADTLPPSYDKRYPLPFTQFWPKQYHEFSSLCRRILTTRAGVKLSKSFLAYFVAYIVCLIPASRDWLGPYNYILALSVIIDHPGRTIGSQIDGLVLTIIGTTAGLAWGSLGLYVSTSTSPARNGYGGVLATFLVLFTALIAWLRCAYIRFYQAVISAGIAICYTCLADTSQTVGWSKVFDYGIPWVLGQAISLILCFLIFPQGGSRPLAVALHDSLKNMQQVLVLPRPNVDSRRDLAWNFVNLSQAVRDLTIEISVSRFHPKDVREIRNLMQSIIRAMLSIRTSTMLLKIDKDITLERGNEGSLETVIDIDDSAGHQINLETMSSSSEAIQLITDVLANPTKNLLETMSQALGGGDAILMDISGYRKYVGPPNDTYSDLPAIYSRLTERMKAFDNADVSLINHPKLPSTYSDHPEVVELFLFVHPVRQTADKVEAFLQKVLNMQERQRKWGVYMPSYSFAKSLQRTNAQVRHDRGGLTAGFYFRSKEELENIMAELQSSTYKPMSRHSTSETKHDMTQPVSRTVGKYEEEKGLAMDRNQVLPESLRMRYQIWTILHRLQGFESRFAFKMVLITTLLSIPAWLQQSHTWWDNNESWWAVVMIWVMMHPRVGGNFQDLITRTFCAVLGAIWGGLAYGAGGGSPYVMGVFAAIFMIPMLYRYTQSAHPRSGLVACVSFTIISLSAYTHKGSPSPAYIAWTRGVAFVVGVVASVIVNWVLWPFVARHELRKSLSSMMLHSAILYRGVVAKYIYYDVGKEPDSEDVEKSEMLEARLREGFVRIRELMELTRHEIRLRGPFDPLPYSALIESCERFFEHLVEVRQSSLYFQPYMVTGGEAATEALLSVRRDAVAAILMNLYILGGALRSDRPVPRYLPRAAAARKRLLDRMSEVEALQSMAPKKPKPGPLRRWADVYQYAYSSALTDIVEQLQQLQRYTKAIVGEFGFEPSDNR